MTIGSVLGTTLGITDAGTLPTDYDDTATTGYTDQTYTLIGEITSIDGEIGASAELVSDDMLAGDRRKAKGVRDGGSFTVTMLLSDADAGQEALEVASNSREKVAIQVVYPDGREVYNIGLVMGAPEMVGAASDTAKVTATFELDDHKFAVASS